MHGRRGLLIGTIGLGVCLVAGCLRGSVPAELRTPRSNVAAHPPRKSADEPKKPDPDPPPSDYNANEGPSVQLDVLTSTAPGKPVEPVEMRIKEERTPPPP